ncbi:MAG: class I SAM-dependent methyltransferase [Chloroflexales bacterium]|nr:class I SAM-dependent methyltransferase [Chloroflexales bacterium]
MASTTLAPGAVDTPRCPHCAGAAALAFRTRDYNRRLSDERFDYYRCARCGLLYLSPAPRDLGRYYPANYYAVPVALPQLAAAADLERYKIDLVRQFVLAGRLLEIGPAYGSFAYLARQAGFAVETIEMDAACCRFLLEVVGVSAVCSSDVPAALEVMQPFDVIALWHVIEHVPDPWRVLDAVAARLRPGGVVVIAAPNPDAFQLRLLGSHWAHVDAPRHLTLIPAALIEQALRPHGLHTVLRTTTDPGSIGWNHFGWEMSLRTWGRWRPARLLLRLLGRAVGVLAQSIEQRDGLGATYTLVLRKEDGR